MSRAETKDIPWLVQRFKNYLEYMTCHGIDAFESDDNLLVGSIMEYLVLKMQNNNHVVLVSRKNKGFIIGAIEIYPGFYRNKQIAIIEYMYPISFTTALLLPEFYDWAKERGAKKVVCLLYRNLDRMIPIYMRGGFDINQTVMSREI